MNNCDLTDHLVEGEANPLIIKAVNVARHDEKMNRHTRYDIIGFNTHPNNHRLLSPLQSPLERFSILFQSGPISETNGPNGITVEALLAISKDRLTELQKGEHPCTNNDLAIQAIELALLCLKDRTKERIKLKESA